MLKLSDKNFKAGVIKILKHSNTFSKQMRKLRNDIEVTKRTKWDV